MLALVQLFLALFAIYSALQFPEQTKLLVPLFCLVLMFVLGRFDKGASEKKKARKTFLRTETDRLWKREKGAIREQDFVTIDSLLWPKTELPFVEATHLIFKDLGFRVSAGGSYQSVDRVIKIPETRIIFGLEFMICEGEAGKDHPKVGRALQFEKEKREREKTLLVASTHTRLPLSERGKITDLSPELNDFLAQRRISLLTTYSLYHLWQKAKVGEINIFGIFERIYTHPGGIFIPDPGDLSPSAPEHPFLNPSMPG